MTNTDRQLSAHFKLSEFACRCGCGVEQRYIKQLENLCTNLELIRSILGVPMVITSGVRCQAHNAEKGGASKSSHLDGRAADFIITDYTSDFVAGAIFALMKQGELASGGIGLYSDTKRKNMIHYDMRGQLVRWRY